jgi:hypothetical protein
LPAAAGISPGAPTDALADDAGAPASTGTPTSTVLQPTNKVTADTAPGHGDGPGKADDQGTVRQATVTVGIQSAAGNRESLKRHAEDDDPVPSDTAAAVAYWYQRDPDKGCPVGPGDGRARPQFIALS